MAFTKESCRDPHVEAKAFVRQHRYGTGGFKCSLDCITDLTMFRRARFWSLDGEFLDDKDPHWICLAREFEYKD